MEKQTIPRVQLNFMLTKKVSQLYHSCANWLIRTETMKVLIVWQLLLNSLFFFFIVIFPPQCTMHRDTMREVYWPEIIFDEAIHNYVVN